jgi:predicted NACHT family NTPase
MVLGGPGVGKSTFLRKMGLEALRRHAIVTNAQNNLDALKPQAHYYAHACIPVLLELRQFNSQTLSIKEIIAQEFEVCGFPKAQEFTELFLQSGKLLVLLDGLDEVPGDALNHAITEIENLVDRYDGNRFIASCRVAAYTFGGFKRFNDVAMAAFEDDQIERFINNWFKKERDIETETAKRCWELLSSPDYQAAKELAQTPLLLTLLCVIYDEFQDFPKDRYKVYGEALDVLLRKWAAEKRLKQEPIYQKFGTELELELLSELATTAL